MARTVNMRQFSHLENREVVEYDYASNLFKKALPIRAFTNTITATFLLGLEKICVISINAIDTIRTYRRI